MSGYFKLIEKLTKRPTTKILHSGSISLSTTKVYMDIGNRVLLFFFYQELKKTKKFWKTKITRKKLILKTVKSVNGQPAGRLIFKIYDDLEEWTSPWAARFLNMATQKDTKKNFIGSEFQRCGHGRGEATMFSVPGKKVFVNYTPRKKMVILFFYIIHGLGLLLSKKI